jgi:hypothetical protein
VQGATHKPDIPMFSAETMRTLPPTDTDAD